MPRKVEAPGSQGPVVGDYNFVFQYFGRAAPELSALIRTAEFQPYVDRRTEGFTGRGFAFSDIEQWLGSPTFGSGYLVVKGEPGIGKTALLGQLVKRRGCVHHFNIARMGITSVSAFLSNVCAQLVVRYGLESCEWPPDATKDGGFLLRLLREAASDPANRPVVVVVDALDEADDMDSPRVNPLFLPPELPDGVFAIVSVRAGHKHEDTFGTRHVIDLDKDLRAWDDAPAFIGYILRSEAETMSENVARWGLSEEDFIAALATRCDNNFMYLRLVLNDIRDGLLTAGNIDRIQDLPSELKKYYQTHWAMMRSRDQQRFRRFEVPVVCLLGTSRLPVSVDQVMAWTRSVWIKKGWDIGELDRNSVIDVVSDWGEYLNEIVVGGERRYTLYHETFRAFLDEDIGLSDYRRAIVGVAIAKVPGFGQHRAVDGTGRGDACDGAASK